MDNPLELTKESVSSLLQLSYYDRRTNYVWKFLLGNDEDFILENFVIDGPESFKAVEDMLHRRKYTLQEFLKQWEEQEHPGLTRCTYSRRTGLLRVTARSFLFTCNTQTWEFTFRVNREVARSIPLAHRDYSRRYRKARIFHLDWLAKLDDELFSRYTEDLRLKRWLRSPAFKADIAYCRAMLPDIMHDAETRRQYLGRARRLNIILSGNDAVRIGIVRLYTPEEMMALPVYPRSQWREGIQAAFEAAARDYAQRLEQTRQQVTRLVRELAGIQRGEATCDVTAYTDRYLHHPVFGDYSDMVVSEALGVTLSDKAMDESIAAVTSANFLFVELIAESRQRIHLPQHAGLVAFVRFLIQQTVPLIAIDSLYIERRREYNIRFVIGDNDDLSVCLSSPFSTYQLALPPVIDGMGTAEAESAFRVWWAQLLLKEIKQAKQFALAPETYLEEELPF